MPAPATFKSIARVMSRRPSESDTRLLNTKSSFSDLMYFPGRSPMSSCSSLLPCFDPSSRPGSIADGDRYPVSFAQVYPDPQVNPPRAASERHLVVRGWVDAVEMEFGSSSADSFVSEVPFSADLGAAHPSVDESLPKAQKKKRWTSLRRSISASGAKALSIKTTGPVSATEIDVSTTTTDSNTFSAGTYDKVSPSHGRTRTHSLFSFGQKPGLKSAQSAETTAPDLPVAAEFMTTGTPPATPTSLFVNRNRAASIACGKTVGVKDSTARSLWSRATGSTKKAIGNASAGKKSTGGVSPRV